MNQLEKLSNDELKHYHKLMLQFKNETTNRKDDIRKTGYSTKFAYNIVRLMLEAEMILTEGDLDLTRNSEQLKSIRRGEWTEKQIRDYFSEKEKNLEQVYLSSKLPYSPDENKIKQLLLQCLETHYGSLDKCIVNVDKYVQTIRDIKKLIDRIE